MTEADGDEEDAGKGRWGFGKSMSWGRDSTDAEDCGARAGELVVHGCGCWLFPAVVYCRFDDLMPRTGSMSEKGVQSALHHMRLRNPYDIILYHNGTVLYNTKSDNENNVK